MPLLVNPTGKFVVIDDPKKFDYWLQQDGFRRATQKEEKQYLNERMAKIKAKELEKHKGKGLYLASVSVGGKDGYGRASDLIKKELTRLDIPVTRYYNDQKVALILHAPPTIARVEAPYRILYTMFESTKIPDEFIPYLKEADKVLVPSTFCKTVFDKAGIKTEVVPLGYEDDVFTYKERENKRKAKKTFNFLHYNAFNVRKGFLELFKAFTQEFEPDEPVKLILKTTLHKAPLPITKSQYPNIEIIRGKKSERELLQILHDSDAFVFPSRGEGFGLTPLEAMATGLPTIVPDAHGISEYFNARFMYEVEVAETCPGIYLRYKGQDVGEMVVCDIEHLRRQMRWIYEHQDEALEVGKKASKYVKKYTIKKTAEHLKAIYEDALMEPTKERKLKDVLTLEKIE